MLEKVGNAGPPPTVTNKWLDEAIQKLLPTHMQLIMGIGNAEEIALAEVKGEFVDEEINIKVKGYIRCAQAGSATAAA